MEDLTTIEYVIANRGLPASLSNRCRAVRRVKDLVRTLLKRTAAKVVKPAGIFDFLIGNCSRHTVAAALPWGKSASSGGTILKREGMVVHG